MKPMNFFALSVILLIGTAQATKNEIDLSKTDFYLLDENNPEQAKKSIFRYFLYTIDKDVNIPELKDLSPESVRKLFYDFFKIYVDQSVKRHYNMEKEAFDASFNVKALIAGHNAYEKYNEKDFDSSDEFICEFISERLGLKIEKSPLSLEKINYLSTVLLYRVSSPIEKNGIIDVTKFYQLENVRSEDQETSLRIFIYYLKETLPRTLYPKLKYIEEFDEDKIINLFKNFFTLKAEAEEGKAQHQVWIRYIEDVSNPQTAKETILKFLNKEGFPVKAIDENAFNQIRSILGKKFDGVKGRGRFYQYVKNALDRAPHDSMFLKQYVSDRACLLASRLGPALQIDSMRARLQNMIVDETEYYIDFKFPHILGPQKIGKIPDYMQEFLGTLETYNRRNEYVYRVQKKMHKSSLLTMRGRIDPLNVDQASLYDKWYNTFSKAYISYSNTDAPKTSYGDMNFYQYQSSYLFSRGIHISMSKEDLDNLKLSSTGDIDVVVNHYDFSKDNSDNIPVTKKRLRFNIANIGFINKGTGHATSIYYSTKHNSWMLFDNQRIQPTENGEPITPEEAKDFFIDSSIDYLILIVESDEKADELIEAAEDKS